MKLAIIYSKVDNCKKLFNFLIKIHEFVSLEEAEAIICLGGDGFMLHTLHKYNYLNLPFYGINCGNLGFLMNDINIINDESFIHTITNSNSFNIVPLEVSFTNRSGQIFSSLAFNEVSLLRNEGVAAHLQISVDSEVRINKLIADGILLSTPLGSTAYNKACGGPQLPLHSNVLALTPINVFKPSNFRGAVLLDKSEVNIQVLLSEQRSINLFCDYLKYSDIIDINIKKSLCKTITLLFDHDNHIIKKSLKSQFKLNNE